MILVPTITSFFGRR